MQATARRLSVVSSTLSDRRRLIRDARPRNSAHNHLAPMKPMNPDELVAAARALAETGYVLGRHQMFAALRTRSGRTYLGSHVEAGNGRMTLCAEAVAIGAAATGLDADVALIVAVTESGQIVAPCGMCRELIRDYGSEARVILQGPSGLEVVGIAELLPRKYSSADYPNTRL